VIKHDKVAFLLSLLLEFLNKKQFCVVLASRMLKLTVNHFCADAYYYWFSVQDQMVKVEELC